MKILLLSCNTGGGHNSCARYIQDELVSNGIECDFKNYFEIVHLSKKDFSNKIYVNSLGKRGGIFNYAYKIGDEYDKTNLTSPVYLVNKLYSSRLYRFIVNNSYDLVICPHLFPAHAMTAINKKHKVPFIFVDTDYEYHPLTHEILADYYIIPKELEGTFIARGVDKNKLVSLGIPISTNYVKTAKNIRKDLKVDKKMVLILLGSMGFGNIESVIGGLLNIKDTTFFIVCGKNQKLYDTLKKYECNNMRILGFTNNVNDLIKSADIVVSKPGGLSTTEIATFRKGLIHMFPIPGVETTNTLYFSSRKMSLIAHDNEELIKHIDTLLNNRDVYNTMIGNQEKYIPSDSAKKLVKFIKDKFE